MQAQGAMSRPVRANVGTQKNVGRSHSEPLLGGEMPVIPVGSSSINRAQALPAPRRRSAAQALYYAKRGLGVVIPLILVVAAGAFFLAPYAWMVLSSLKSFKEAFSGTPHWLPRKWEWSNYPRSLTDIPFFLYMRNSLIICTATVVGTLLSSSITAYSISRMRWWGRMPLFIIVLMTMMLPYQVTIFTLPVVLVYLFGQRWLVRSIATTGFR